MSHELLSSLLACELRQHIGMCTETKRKPRLQIHSTYAQMQGTMKDGKKNWHCKCDQQKMI